MTTITTHFTHIPFQMTWGTDHDQDHWRSVKEGLQEGPDQDQGPNKNPNCMEKTEPAQILQPNIGM